MINILQKKTRRFLPLTFRKVAPSAIVDVSHYTTLPPGYHSTNPSILPFEDGFLVSIRGINYVFAEQDMGRTVFTAGTSYHTLNRFFLLDCNLKLKRHLPELNDAFDNIEDIKLFSFEGRVLGLGSVADPARGQGACSVALIDFDRDLTNGTVRVIPSPFGLRQEKNWAPFEDNGRLHFIYSFDPLVVLKYDFERGSVACAHPAGQRLTKSELKFVIGGSSAGIPFKGGHLFAAHRRRVSLPGFERLYISRIYHLDKSQTKLRAGRYFTMGSSIQFTNGLVFRGGELVVAYGGQADRDAHAHLCIVQPRDVMPALGRSS